MTGFNLGCVDEIDTFQIQDIQVIDGQNHPLDKKIRYAPKNQELSKG